ncbi:4Fe-4S binding protein [Aestuariivivens marinum]|uniref:4Fe-4S binding protein n=1 Tax=Aestuariivivens marinum TaxID=2913555 RepID=UPI001F55DA7E|nr:4Fe-4S binding protein [Aestuariivivens marinum]
MKASFHSILNANQAVARIAYQTNEVFPIYPITPASEISELVEAWSAQKLTNCFGNVPSVFQMQSEAGVAGAMHGALQTGSLSSTFTASQGLLLMLPNMYKIAGELTPNVIHVATRSVATHALSVFGDHSDIMAVRQSGYAMLGSASVQEAQDFALIAKTASLESRIPFVHFFDGFRTSHEIAKIETISNDVIKSMMSSKAIESHKARALNPNNPVIRGTAQGPDVFFQSRESINSFYNACPNIVQKHMDAFALKTNRHYKLFEYVGDPKAEQIIVAMASSTETIETTIKHLNQQGNKFGLIKVRLFRPFSMEHLLQALPKTTKSIAVLDRTKEPGSTGEPLYLDVLKSITEAYQNDLIHSFPKIFGGRYGLSSKEFNPVMVQAVFDNLKKDKPKNNFTVGIHDDVTKLSLEYNNTPLFNDNTYQAIFYQEKNDSNNKSFANTIKLLGKNSYIQGYTQISYKKSNAYDIAHLRLSKTKIKAPYLIDEADFLACHNINLRENGSIIKNIKAKGILLVNTSLQTDMFWQSLSCKTQQYIINKQIDLRIVDLTKLNNIIPLKNININALHACFLSIKNENVDNDEKNTLFLDDFINKVNISTPFKEEKTVPFSDDFYNTLLGKMLSNKGDEISVSSLPVDGTYPTNTSVFNTPQNSSFFPKWNTDLCTQCGACSMACPQAALRIKVYDDSYLESSPRAMKYMASNDFDLKNYTIQINPDQCNGCNNCIDACPAKALKATHKEPNLTKEQINWNYFESIPEFDRNKIDVTKISQQQLQEPLFKYATGIKGCGEAPYLKLMSQLFGNRLLIANATGASSIFGGALPTTPWSKNSKGQGPAWSNSLFEDNAEFGLGFRMSINQQEQQAKTLLKDLATELPFNLVYDILNAEQTDEIGINEQRQRITSLKTILKNIDSEDSEKLLKLADSFIKKSVWIVGGDGWAYDIGYGGLDHVLASGENVNILVLDNEVYDNTGGQASKATPFGAQAKFDFNGKTKQKKDLGLLAMNYNDVYVASVAIGADQEQTLKAFNEAENFNGPSIIIAYCHSDSHGIDMTKPYQYHKAAVNSGQWLLYRHDPRKTKALQLDSNEPSIKIEDYLKLEGRFKKLFKKNKEALIPWLRQYQKVIDKRFDNYLMRSSSTFINRSKIISNNRIFKSLKPVTRHHIN